METEEERQARRRARIAEMKRAKRRRELLYKWGVPAMAAVAVMAGVGIGFRAAAFSNGDTGRTEEEGMVLTDGAAPEGIHQKSGDMPIGFLMAASRGVSQGEVRKEQIPEDAAVPMAGPPVEAKTPLPLAEAVPAPVFQMEDYTEMFTEDILSQYGIFIDAESGAILAEREAHTRMNPASMTKILTVLVAAEHLTEADLDQTATITIDITDYSYVNDCSITGYVVDETVTVRDLFYGTILPAGADSAVALAVYVAGSHEAFVNLMNEKLAQLGLAGSSHFTNCVGLYDENHYTTAYDMAVMLKAAADNAFCREVMSAHTYTTSPTEQHPDGLKVSNLFLRRIEDRDTHGEVLCGKTGFVDQSGSCAASLGVDNAGREYLCVTAGSATKWTCIADHVVLYQRFLPGNGDMP